MQSNSAVVLANLAQRINTEHEAARAAMRKGLQHALNAGELLIEAKAAVPHGEWLPWLETNCSVSERTAQLYMKVARERERLGRESASLADLTLEQAAERLAKPKPPTLVERPSPDNLLNRLRQYLALFPEATEAADGKEFNVLEKPQLLVDALTFYRSDAAEAAERLKLPLHIFNEAFKAALVCGFRPLWGYALRDQVINTRFCVAPLEEVLAELDEYDAEREAEELERRWVLAHNG